MALTQEQKDLVAKYKKLGLPNEAIKRAILNSQAPASTSESSDINPLARLGKIVKGAWNVLEAPAAAVLGLAYEGDLKELAASEGWKNIQKKYAESENILEQPSFQEGIAALGRNLGRAAEATNIGLPQSDVYLQKSFEQPLGSTQYEKGKGLLPMLTLPFRSAYGNLEGHPLAQSIVSGASNVAFDPLSLYSPLDRFIGKTFEKAGKFVHGFPFAKADEEMLEKGFGSLKDLAYDKSLFGTSKQMNTQLKKYIKDTTKETKGLIKGLSEQGIGGSPSELEAPLLASLQETVSKTKLPKKPSFATSEADIAHYLSVDVDPSKLMKDDQFLGKMWKHSQETQAKKVWEAGGKAGPAPKVSPFPETDRLSLAEINARKAELNSDMKRLEFDITSEGKDSPAYENLRRIRDQYQAWEERLISGADPELGKLIKTENKNLSTAISGRKFTARGAKRGIMDVMSPSTALPWAINKSAIPLLTAPPIAYKTLRQTPVIGGMADTALRRNLFEILAELRNVDNPALKFTPINRENNK